MVSENKTAIITGAARGIGKAIATTLAEDKINIVISDIDMDIALQTKEEILKMGVDAIAVRTDVSLHQDAEELTSKTIEKFGRIDILVNNAGVTKDSLLVRMKDEDWDFVINVNLKGTFNCTRAVSKVMMKQKNGRIVNISSVVGIMGNSGQANYSASKAGIIGFTKAVAKELASRGILVNAIAPGFIDTDMTRALSNELRENLLKIIPLGRLGMDKDVAEAVRFLVSDRASYITGQVIHVNGGMLM